MSLLNRSVLAAMRFTPTPIVRRLALRYIAGETLEQALAVLERVGARGHPGIIDLLGESVHDEAGARAALAGYEDAARAVERRGIDAYVSVKPTHFGLELDQDLCAELYATLAGSCRDLGLFLRVEMEDASTTDATLRVYEGLRERFDDVGVVLQARLFRTPDDIARLAGRFGAGLDVRLVKGIYLEPARIAHTAHAAIRDAYVACAGQLFEAGARVALATHDEPMAGRCLAAAPAGARYEMEVLLGVCEDLWERWSAAGHRVRVYVPYGADWKAYSMRRFRENPEILGHVLRDLVRLR
jgi:proline dehydrogenase